MLSGQSLPVAFGPEAAKWICVGAIDITQISVAGMLSLIYVILLLLFIIVAIATTFINGRLLISYQTQSLVHASLYL